MLIRIFTTINLFRVGEIPANPPRLNPIHLSVATTGYCDQVHTLGIPDCFGIFSPVSPRVQNFEAESFVYVVRILLFTIAGC